MPQGSQETKKMPQSACHTQSCPRKCPCSLCRTLHRRVKLSTEHASARSVFVETRFRLRPASSLVNVMFECTP
ncbi:hypothetical protein M3J09_011250 [Ascochyta lentis]